MSASANLLRAIQSSPEGLSLAALQARFPDFARRSVQRWLAKWLAEGQIGATGEARARRYFGLLPPSNQSANKPAISSLVARMPTAAYGAFPDFIPLSADSRDVLAYVDQPLAARKPVGYQREFLAAYEPNHSFYLSAPLRRQLWQMGQTGQERLPAGTYSRAILSRLLIDLSWASSRLEGNTYSLLDTRRLIEQGQVAAGKAREETQMILNHKGAIELLVGGLDGELNSETPALGLNRYTLCNLHAVLAENLLPNPADEGRVRPHGVEIGLSVYRPLGTPQQIDEVLDELLDKASRIIDPFEQSFFLMVHLPYLQPFADINKRTSRLAANLPLFRANLCPLTFLDVPELAYSRAILGVYEMTRVELLRDVYVWAYERSTQEYLVLRQQLAEPDPLRLAYRDLLRQVIAEVVRQPAVDPLTIIGARVASSVAIAEREAVQALLIEELRRLHEGVLVRYGLRPSELATWLTAQRRH